MQDLERARDAAKRAERTARHQLGKFLLRHGKRHPGKTAWTRKHLDWVRTQRFEHEAQQRVLEDYLKTVEDLGERVNRHTRSIVELVEGWSLKPLVKALQALRGVNIIAATVLAAELGDLARFQTAPELMGYPGLVPSEHSSGETRHQGRITRAGNGYARRILVEAAWAYRFRAHKSRAIRARSRGVSEEVQRIAWRAQEGLCARYRKLTARSKNKNRTVIAIARELAGFVWAIGRQPQLLEA